MIFIQKNRKWITYAVNIPNPADIYLLKVNKKRTKARCEICSKLTIKTPERRRRRSGVFIVNFKRISHLAPVFLLLTLNIKFPAGKFSLDFFFFPFSWEPYFMKTRWNIIKPTSRVVWPWYLRPKIRKITGKKLLKILQVYFLCG